jgi:outer membrane protein OmpA-like peptidoglycan-associated protein
MEEGEMPMSIVTPAEPLLPNRRSRTIEVASIVALVLLISFSAFFWIQLRRIQSRLQNASEQIESLTRKQENLSSDLRRSLDETHTAREQTKAAESRAATSELAEAQASKEAVQAQAGKTLADQQTLEAQRQAQNAREELDQMRKAREEELNRMQDALSKVAATRRTPEGMIIELGNDSFKFDFDKAILRPENRELLSRLAGIFLASHGYRLHIYGYTDDIGTDQYNQSLSERRAKAVSDYLAQSGVPAEIMSAKGFGKATPRVKGTSLEARDKNRRVEIGIVDTQIKYPEQTP